MKWLVRVVGGLLLLLVAATAVSFLLPRHVTVARSIVVDAPPEEVYPHINSLQRATRWSPWIERGDDVVISYIGPESGVGNRMEWSSDDLSIGTGAQEIVAVDENRRVDTALDLGEMGVAEAALILEPENGGTRVTWTLDTDMGMNPVFRWMGLMFDGWVGTDYEKGLAKLETIVER